MSKVFRAATRPKDSAVMMLTLWGIVVYFDPCGATHLPNQAPRIRLKE
jgi:hypothetical protein